MQFKENMQIYSSPDGLFKLTVEEGPEFRMGAYRRKFTLPAPIDSFETLHTINGSAIFLNNHWLIIYESTLVLLFDLIKNQVYHNEEFTHFKVEDDEVRILSEGTPPIVRCKINEVANFFKKGAPELFDGRFPLAVQCWK